MRKNTLKSYEYIEKIIPKESDLMFEARKASESLGLDSISISATEAQLIKFQLRQIQAQCVIEIGTLTGLSALHILQILPKDGFLLTLEKSEQHANLAQEALQDPIQLGRCQIQVGDAREILKSLEMAIKEKTFTKKIDAVFIDGNKSAYLDYFLWAIENVRSGGLIFVDNIFLAGAVWGDQTKQKFNQKQIQSVHQVNLTAFSDDRLFSMIVPTEEGLLIAQKK